MDEAKISEVAWYPLTTTWEPWAMEFTGPPADGLTPTGQCRRFIADNLRPHGKMQRREANERNGEFDDNLLKNLLAQD